MKKTSCEHYCSIFYDICQNNNRMGLASLHLPAKYPQLPALLVGQIQTLIWRIPGRMGPLDSRGAHAGLQVANLEGRVRGGEGGEDLRGGPPREYLKGHNTQHSAHTGQILSK